MPVLKEDSLIKLATISPTIITIKVIVMGRINLWTSWGAKDPEGFLDFIR
jgi:hypothetical protein